MAAPLEASEELLVGAWIITSGGIVPDAVCARIDDLVRDELELVAHHPEWGAWESLLLDPANGQLWERYYPSGEMHGGGPPALRRIQAAEALAKYKLKSLDGVA